MSDPDNIIAELESEFVELYKILKFEGLSESGGSAKQAIADGLVSEVTLRGEIVSGRLHRPVAIGRGPPR
mgnify:CR=1 FL=1